MTRRNLACLFVALVLGALVPTAASADEAEPPIIAQAWYWEPQENEEVVTPVGNIAGELPNPFCPGVGSGTGAASDVCAEGRLPVEVVNGDYETPDKVSAVAFEFSTVPVGSKILEFTVSFLEAESGCYEKEGSTTGQQCENTDAQNAEDKLLQACMVKEIFGDGEARPYEELPKYDCGASPPTAKRKQVKNDAEADPTDQDPDHVWTFDLSEFATEWTEEFTASSAIQIRPAAPEDAGGSPDDPSDVDWRVVLAGPKFPGGVVTNLVYEPPKGGIAPPPPPPGSDPIGAPPGAGTDFGTTSDTGFTTGTDPNGGLTPTTTDPAADGAPATDAAGDPVAVGDEQEPTAAVGEGTLPGYVWLALLAGLIGFSMVRNVVLEKAAGQRPDGVLAQIHRLNAERRGAAVAAAAAGGGAIVTGLSSLGGALRPAVSKLAAVGTKLRNLRKG